MGLDYNETVFSPDRPGDGGVVDRGVAPVAAPEDAPRRPGTGLANAACMTARPGRRIASDTGRKARRALAEAGDEVRKSLDEAGNEIREAIDEARDEVHQAVRRSARVAGCR